MVCFSEALSFKHQHWRCPLLDDLSTWERTSQLLVTVHYSLYVVYSEVFYLDTALEIPLGLYWHYWYADFTLSDWLLQLQRKTSRFLDSRTVPWSQHSTRLVHWGTEASPQLCPAASSGTVSTVSTQESDGCPPSHTHQGKCSEAFTVKYKPFLYDSNILSQLLALFFFFFFWTKFEQWIHQLEKAD